MKIAVVGAGKLGLKITEALLGGDHSLAVIDEDEEILSKLSSHMDVMTVLGNGQEAKVLKDLGIEDYDYLIACTNSDAKNIVIASMAKNLDCPVTIARVRGPEHMNQFDFLKDSFKIDALVNPDLSIALEIHKYLVEKYTLSNGIFTSGKLAVIEMSVNNMPSLINVSLRNIDKHLPGMLVFAVSRNGKIIIPDKDMTFIKDDELYVVGEKAPIMKLDSKVHIKGKYTNLQRTMIIGGGKSGYYLAQKLSEFGIAVKIVEIDKERCHYLANHLEDVMILNGDGTDINFLESENLDEMDAFVTTTGYDEENLLLALMAKQRGIEDVIAKISRESYFGLIESMGVDMALNPVDITASNILRFIQGGKKVLSSQMIQGQAEIVEIIAGRHMSILNTPLRDLDFPEGARVAAIHRGPHLILPNGDTEILAGDRVLMICLLSELSTLERLLKETGPLGLFG